MAAPLPPSAEGVTPFHQELGALFVLEELPQLTGNGNCSFVQGHYLALFLPFPLLESCFFSDQQ